MSISEEQFNSLNDQQKWELYTKASVDRAAFEELGQKLTTAIDALRKCEEEVVKVKGQLKVNGAVNKKLSSDVKLLQKRLNELDQYGRRENVVVTNVPTTLPNDDIERKIITLLYKSNLVVRPCDIVACHRTKKKSSVIVRFVNRKDAMSAVKNSRKIRELDTSDIWGENLDNSIYPNLTPLNMRLRYIAKKLKGRRLISNFGSSVFGIWITREDDSDKEPVNSEDDLAQFLPEDTPLSDLLAEE